MKVHASITDFPVFSQLETFFKEFKAAGVDGLELVIGVKSRFEFARILYLSEKYDLPIASVHQPAWSGIGVYFDEAFVEFAKKLGTRRIVFHPLAFHSFTSPAGIAYLERLAHLQETHDITVMLENMPKDMVYQRLHDSTPEHILHHLETVGEIADTYGFLLTYDVSHAELTHPQNTDIFPKLLPKIGNIHASSFIPGKHHLPLNTGTLDTVGFVQFLQQKKYNGLFTLEVYYPKLELLMNRYDFTAIAQSVKVVKKAADK